MEAARDHFKSSVWSYAYPLFLVQRVHNPGDAFPVALFSYASVQAEENLRRIRQQIEGNHYLRWLLPESKSFVWDAGNLEMSNGCTIKAYGFGSSFRGRHPKYIIIDDPCKDEGTGTMSIEQQVKFFESVIVPAAKADSQIVITGNPVGLVDFLSWVESNPAFSKHFYPLYDDRGRLLCPEHMNEAAVAKKRALVKSAHAWASQYLLKRISPDESRFKEEWFEFYGREKIEGFVLYKVMTIDPAMNPGGDALAAVTTGTDRKDNTYILDRLRFRGDLDVGIGLLCDMMERHRPDFIGFEQFAFQSLYKLRLEEEIERRGLGFHVVEVGRDSKKKKSARIESLQPKLAAHKLFFLEEHKPMIDQFLLWIPTSKNNEDDEIDALSWQPPLWRSPYTDAEPDATHGVGTWGEAMAQMEAAKSGGYIQKLFEDFRA